MAKNITIREDIQEPGHWFWASKYLVITPDLRQRIYDDYLDAEQAYYRAEMGGDPAETYEAQLAWYAAFDAWKEVRDTGELLISFCDKEYYTQYWK